MTQELTFCAHIMFMTGCDSPVYAYDIHLVLIMLVQAECLRFSAAKPTWWLLIMVYGKW